VRRGGDLGAIASRFRRVLRRSRGGRRGILLRERFSRRPEDANESAHDQRLRERA